MFDKIINSTFIQLALIPFREDYTIEYYGPYFERFNVYTFKCKRIDDLVLRDLERGSLMFKVLGYIQENYAWHIGTAAKYFIVAFPLLFVMLYILDSYKYDKNCYLTKSITFFISWIKFFHEKLENMLEGYFSVKFFFFFLFLFFSNLFCYDDGINYVVFIEWNIPVCFGLILITELILILKSYIYIYLNGSKTKKIILVTFFEDLINFLILTVRIMLQLIRGIICSIYHDLLRDCSRRAIWSLHRRNFDWIAEIDLSDLDYRIKLFNKVLFIIFYLLIVSFAIILMFLQALFLFLAVWLFCKCWFMSVFISKNLFKNKISLTKYFEDK